MKNEFSSSSRPNKQAKATAGECLQYDGIIGSK